MAQKKKTKVVKKAVHKKIAKRSAHPGYHPEHIAMMYRLGGASIVVLGGTAIIFIIKNALGLS